MLKRTAIIAAATVALASFASVQAANSAKAIAGPTAAPSAKPGSMTATGIAAPPETP